MKEQFQAYTAKEIANAREKCGNPTVLESAEGPCGIAGDFQIEAMFSIENFNFKQFPIEFLFLIEISI